MKTKDLQALLPEITKNRLPACHTPCILTLGAAWVPRKNKGRPSSNSDGKMRCCTRALLLRMLTAGTAGNGTGPHPASPEELIKTNRPHFACLHGVQMIGRRKRVENRSQPNARVCLSL
jgi:hypothetical protein